MTSMNHFTRTCPATGRRTLTIGDFWARFHPDLAQAAVDRFRKANKTCDFVEVRETMSGVELSITCTWQSPKSCWTGSTT